MTESIQGSTTGTHSTATAQPRIRETTSSTPSVLGGARLAYAAPPTQLLVLRPPGLTRQLLNPAACLRAMRSAAASWAGGAVTRARAARALREHIREHGPEALLPAHTPAGHADPGAEAGPGAA